ncbi:MAG: D-sedoheptulose 7-phosphate isomerase [bacterium]
MMIRIDQALAAHEKMVQGLNAQVKETIEAGADAIFQALKKGSKVLVMGNGGSAADAQHLAAEFVGRFLHERKALPAVALTTDTSILTAIGNDYGYDSVFVRQIEALAVRGDVVIGISTSGRSKNVILALNRAKEIGCFTLGLTGGDGGEISRITDLSLVVPSRDTPRIQEGHILVIHILCDLVEQRFV